MFVYGESADARMFADRPVHRHTVGAFAERVRKANLERVQANTL